MAHDVFISYSTKDKSVADAVCAGLEASGIRCWISPRDILPGEEFDEAIIRAINDAKLVVVIFSSNVFDSKWAKGEIQKAFDKGLPIIPFRIELVEPHGGLELLLGRTHWLDALTQPIETHIERLAQTVHAMFAASETSHTEISKPFGQLNPPSPQVLRKKQSPRFRPAYVILIVFILLAGLGGGIWWLIHHENEARIKSELTDQIAADVTDMMTAIQFVEVGATSYSQAQYDQAYQKWESDRAVIKSQIQVDFPKSQLAEEWDAYSGIVSEVYALSGTYMPDYRSHRINRIQAYLVANNLDQNIDWSTLAKIEYRQADYDKQQEYLRAWFALKDQILKRKDELIMEILGSN